MTELDVFVEAETAPPGYALLAVSPHGVARETTTIPTDDAGFESLRVRVCGREKGVAIREQFGRLLFDAVFHGPILALWSQAASDPEGARLRLIVEPPALSTLPWELLNDGKNFLATDASLGVSRYIPVPEPRAVPLADRVKVLLVTARPDPLPDIPASEVDALAAEIASAGEVTVLRNATAPLLDDAIASGEYHAVHYLGHGTRGALLLASADGTVAPLTDRAFAQMLFGRASVRLVVLTACASAQTDGDAFAGVGPALIRTRVAAVVAMQYEFVQLSTAQTFSRRLYGQLSAGAAIDVAVNQARNTIASTPTLLEQRDWSTPVLYLGTRSGRLITLKSQQTGLVDRAAQSVALAAMKDPAAARGWQDLQDTFRDLRGSYATLGALTQLHAAVTQTKDEFDDVVRAADEGLSSETFATIRTRWQQISTGSLARLTHEAANLTDPPLQARVDPLTAHAEQISKAIAAISLLDLAREIASTRDALVGLNLELTTRIGRTIADLIAASERTLGRIAAQNN